MEDERFKGVVVWLKVYKLDPKFLEWIKENDPEEALEKQAAKIQELQNTLKDKDEEWKKKIKDKISDSEKQIEGFEKTTGVNSLIRYHRILIEAYKTLLE